MTRTRRLLTVFALVGALTVNLMAAGTVTMTSARSGTATPGIMKYTIAWTSDAAGAVNGNTLAIRTGRIIKAEIVPASGGTQPTDLYDLELQDGRDVDLLAGAGANQSNAAAEIALFNPPLYVDDASLELVVANAGNAKGGTVLVWVE